MFLVMRLRPFDTSTTEGRARERERRVALTALASLGARSISILTALVSVPLTLVYLGTERYGLWMTISAAVALFAFADLGMGNGLLNAISEANGRDDRDAARRYVSSAFLMLSGLALAVGVVFAAAYPFISWRAVFNVSSPEAASEAGPAMAVFVGCLLVSLPLGVVDRVQLGYQDGFVNALWRACGNVLGLGAVLLAIALSAGLPWLVLAMAGAPILAGLANGVVLFGWRNRSLRPSLGSATRPAARRVFQIGLLFLVLQIAVAMAYGSDTIVVAQVIGPKAVAEYAVVFRLFMFVPMLVGMALIPLWPAYAEAIARGDAAWVRRTLVRSLRLSVLATAPAALVLVALGSRIVDLWVGSAVTPSFALILGFGVWMVLGTVGNAIAMFLNAANIVRFQVVAALCMATSNLALSIVLARTMGVAGVIWGTVLAYSVCSVVPIAVYVPTLLQRLGRAWPVDRHVDALRPQPYTGEIDGS